MHEKELKYISKRIKRLHKKRYFSDRQVYIFGVSDNSRQIIKAFRKCGIEPAAVLDNDPQRQGSFCARVEVISVEECFLKREKEPVFAIHSPFWHEMKAQLETCGIPKKRILVLNGRRGVLAWHFLDSCKGLILYRKIVGKRHAGPVFLCPYTGTGDIYLIGTFWKEYCQRNQIRNYRFLVVSSACRKAAQLCGIKNVCQLKKKEYAGYLIDAYKLWPERAKMKILNDGWGQIHTNQTEWFRGYKNLDFTSMFRKFVFDLPDDSVPVHPDFHAGEKAEAFMKEGGLPLGKTVILSPYSNTLADLPDSLWVHMAKRLKKMGFTVCTNSSGEEEPEIKGTIPVCFPLTLAPAVVEKAGAFIGVRSGFCDIISGANAKKIILYDKNNRFYMSSALEYFSLKTMKLCENAEELEYDKENYEEIIRRIECLMKGN